jgi:hypothetical protein
VGVAARRAVALIADEALGGHARFDEAILLALREPETSNPTVHGG